MKKFLKIAGIIILVLIVIGVIAGGSKNKNSSVKEAFNEGQEKAKETIQQTGQFTKEDALKKIQEYRITVDLKFPDIPKGTTILEAYEIKGKVPTIKNLGWFSEDTDEEGKYIVGFKQTVSEDLSQEPRWEVTKDAIKAVNGKAITITPEFGPKE